MLIGVVQRFLFPLLAIGSGITVTTWVLPRSLGYGLSIATLLVIIGYTAICTNIRWQIDRIFFVFFGSFWLLLVMNYVITQQGEVLQYILVIPIAVTATVIVLPHFIAADRIRFVAGVTALAVACTIVGIAMLIVETQTAVNLYQGIEARGLGDDVMGFEGLRIVSVFHNANTYGFFMLLGSLSALYGYLERGDVLWGLGLLLALLGLLLSEGDASYIGFAIGGVLLCFAHDRRYALGFFGLSVLIAAVMIQIGHIPEVYDRSVRGGRAIRWTASLQRLQQDPLFGIGFAGPAAEIAPYHDLNVNGPHNSYVHIFLNTGVIAGTLYVASFAWAVWQGVDRQLTRWNAYVLGTTLAIFQFMFFESLTLGGLSMTSIVLGIFIGLCLYPTASP